MHQYTLHEERQFLNVLTIMDSLVPDDIVSQLQPLDCALPILAAYTHDLGMALSQEEHDQLLDESTEHGKHFASYRTRFDEELCHLERWRKRAVELSGRTVAESEQHRAAAKRRIASTEGFILASYLRETHTEDDQVRRLRHWLGEIRKETGDENVFRYGTNGKDYQRTLALFGISHGRGAPWLRRHLESTITLMMYMNRYAQTVGWTRTSRHNFETDTARCITWMTRLAFNSSGRMFRKPRFP